MIDAKFSFMWIIWEVNKNCLKLWIYWESIHLCKFFFLVIVGKLLLVANHHFGALFPVSNMKFVVTILRPIILFLVIGVVTIPLMKNYIPNVYYMVQNYFYWQFFLSSLGMLDSRAHLDSYTFQHAGFHELLFCSSHVGLCLVRLRHIQV